jgi:predicted membrane protein
MPSETLFHSLVSRTLGQTTGQSDVGPATANHSATADASHLSTASAIIIVIIAVLLLLSIIVGFWYFMISARHKRSKQGRTQDGNLEDGYVKNETRQRWYETRRETDGHPWDSDVELVNDAGEMVVVPKDAHVKH